MSLLNELAAKPVFAMLHLTGATATERLLTARRETAALVAGGVDGVIVENYFGNKDDVRAILEWLSEHPPGVAIGLNVLRDYRLAFDLAEEFPVDFIQIDSVAGHLAPAEDADYAAELAQRRAYTDAALFGGVRFKYQPVQSGRSEEEDLRIGMERCDAIVVTGDATGQPTGLDKIRRFRAVTGPGFPLLIGAGLTATSAAQQLSVADGAIVGSFFKDTRVDTGIVLGAHVTELMDVVRGVRTDVRPIAPSA